MSSRGDTSTPAEVGRLLDLTAVAAYLGLTERQVRELVATRKIPVTRIDRRLRFDVVAIEKWIARRTEAAA